MSHDLALSELKFDFNEPYSKVRLLPLLHLAKIALLDQTPLIGSCSHAKLLAFKRALEISGLNIELAGKMGKRTRFQKNDIAQLVLNTESSASAENVEDTDVPINCPLNDDTLLEK
ncbi:unnamed protein product, partial [Strongylus vulgaris]